jgi:acetyl esterase
MEDGCGSAAGGAGMTMDPGARAYVDRVKAGLPIWELTLEEARRGVDAETLEVFGPVDEVASVEDRVVDGVRVRLYRPDAEGPVPALVFFHGGGWVVGSLESHDPVCRAIAARGPAVVVSVDYRLAPEHCFPAGVEDAWTATEWVASHLDELGADRFAVGGDSSGGNLAAVVALRARDLGLPLALQVLIYPVTDCDLDSPGYAEHGVGLNLTRAKMEWYWGKYMDGADPAQPEASPLRAAAVAGVAPALIIAAAYDPLAHEAEEYARRLEAAGVSVELRRYEGQIHGFVRLAALTPDAGRALDEIAAALSVATAR